tara:strand:- start:5876 stop:6631 length:756 start_codon:yes stop_codon:yes gene_type:complete
METCIYKKTWDELSVFEKSGWRQTLRCLPWVKENPSDIMQGKLPDQLKAFYQFGVYTGKSMIVVLDALEKAGKEINVSYGFDSFEGLPQRTNEERDRVIEKHGKYLWSAGDYSSDELYGVEDSREFLQTVFDEYLSTEVKLIRGFYEDTLNSKTVKKYNLQPAAYIDIDVDTYESCVEVLDFIFDEGIVSHGTIIGFDDWGGTPGWEEMKNGVSQAFKECQEKYNFHADLICQIGNAYPQVQAIYLIKENT